MHRLLSQQRKAIVLISVLLCSALSSVAQSDQKTRVLFIGNSYTYFNNLPAIVSQLAASAKSPRRVEAEMFVEGGATLQKLWDGGGALAMLRQGHWDYVVLQEQSTLGNAGAVNGVPRINDPANFFQYARMFDAEIKKAGAKTVFYLTWARQNSPENQAKLTDAYVSIARELNAVLAPVGVAWQAALQENTNLVLHQVDGSHPNPAGSYLAACVLYAAIFSQTPVGLTNHITGKPVDFAGHVFNAESDGVFSSASDVELVNLNPAEALRLQKTAWQTYETRKLLTSSRP